MSRSHIKRNRIAKAKKTSLKQSKQKEKSQRRVQRSSEFDFNLMKIMAMQSCHVIINKENIDYEI